MWQDCFHIEFVCLHIYMLLSEMSEEIKKVCCILDFDGFGFRHYSPNKTYKNEFLIREIGFIKIDPAMGDVLAKSFRFDLTFFDFTHCTDSWSTINYQSRQVNGLSFKPLPGEKVYPYNQVHECIKTIYDLCRIPGRDIVAYKGGDEERKILDELNIKKLDLNEYLCPKFEEILNQKMVFSPIINCGFHRRLDESHVGLVHCPMTEVTVFKDWLLFQYPPRSDEIDGNRNLCGSTVDSSPQLSRAASSSDLSSS